MPVPSVRRCGPAAPQICPRELLGDDQFTISGAAGITGGDLIFGAVPTVGRHHDPAFPAALVNSDDPRAGRVELADDPRLDVPGVELDQPRRRTFADRQRLAGLGLLKPPDRRGTRLRPGDRAGKRRAVLVASAPLDDGYLGRRRPAASRRSAARVTAPERSISRSRLRSLARLAGATPKARPISRAPTGEGLSRINARTSSLEGSSEIFARDLNDRQAGIARHSCPSLGSAKPPT